MRTLLRKIGRDVVSSRSARDAPLVRRLRGSWAEMRDLKLILEDSKGHVYLGNRESKGDEWCSLYQWNGKEEDPPFLLKEKVRNATLFNDEVYFSVVDEKTLHAKVIEKYDGIEVFHTDRKGSALDVFCSKSGELLVVSNVQLDSTEVHISRRSQDRGTLHLVRPHENGIRYFVEHTGRWMFIISNKGNSDGNFSLHRCLLGKNDWSNWEKCPGSGHPEFHLEEIDTFDNFVLLFERNVVSCDQRLRVIDAESCETLCQQSFENGKYVELGMFEKYNSVRPEEIIEFATEERSNLNTEDFDVRREFTAEDGVPLTLTARSGTLQNCTRRPRPCLIVSYGHYGVPLVPRIEPWMKNLIESGDFLIVHAHIRGGGEKGMVWARAGRGRKIWNGVRDLENAINFLHESGWAKKGSTSLITESAGAVKVAALVSNRPGLVEKVIFVAPFLGFLFDAIDPLRSFDETEFKGFKSEFKRFVDTEQILVIAGKEDRRINLAAIEEVFHPDTIYLLEELGHEIQIEGPVEVAVRRFLNLP